MVDGYVNQVTVTFQKFSPEMIPTVATVDISMHAIYQGFTRQKSAFTTFIRLQHELDKDDDTSDGSKETYTGDDVYVRGLAAQGGVEYGGAPLFTGFDHRGDGLKVSTFNTPLKTTDPGCRQRQQIVLDEGLSFAPFCYLHDTQLGKVISEQISRVDQSSGVFEGESTGHWVSNNIDAHVWTGLQVRARLKALGDETGQSDPKAKLAMAVLLDGDTGITNYGEDGEVFFTEWSKGMRSDLLTVGYDNMAKTEWRKSKIKEGFGDPTDNTGQFEDVGPYYTRSFPILANGMEGNPEYGDQLYMQEFHAQGGLHIDWQADAEGSEADRKLKGAPFAHIHGGPDGALKWGQDEEGTNPVTFYIAKGFWSNGEYPWSSTEVHQAAPFIDKLRIYRNGHGYNDDDPEYKEFAIEYQINILYRVKVTQTVEGGRFSDTDWLVVHPRDARLRYVYEGSEGDLLKASVDTHPLNWEGTNIDRLNSDDLQTDVWIGGHTIQGNQAKDLEFYFDGYSYDEEGGGVHTWPQTLYQSHEGNHRGAFFQEGHAGGGLFKKLRTEE